MPVVSVTHTNPLMSLGVFSFSFSFGERVEEECNLVFILDITAETLASYIKQSTWPRGKQEQRKRSQKHNNPKGVAKGRRNKLFL
jgi:hypothetical protein